MTFDDELQRRFDAAGTAVGLDPGSPDSIRAVAGRRARNRRMVVTATAAALFLVGTGAVLSRLPERTEAVQSAGPDASAETDGEITEEPDESNEDPVLVVPDEETSDPDDSSSDGAEPGDPAEDDQDGDDQDGDDQDGDEADGPQTGPVTEADFTYLGAFLAPIGDHGSSRFAYGGAAAAHNPYGDPGGTDGFDGSLFLSGHPVDNPGVAEITIPSPAAHDGSTVGLPIAEVLQPFADLTAGRGMSFVGGSSVGGSDDFRYSGFEVAVGPDGPRLHWTILQYNNATGNVVPGHGHSALDLSAPDPQGPWFLGSESGQVTAGYVFEVPQSFANDNLGGRHLIAGLGDDIATPWAATGPPFFAFAPPETAEPDATVDALALVRYDAEHPLDGFGMADTAGGADWVTTAGGADAVVTVGRRGLGTVRLGPPGPDDCGINSATHAGPYEPLVMFYDPADLAAVAAGDRQPWDVEPYRTWNPAEHLIPTCDQHLTSVSFDERSGRLYIVQPEADTSQSRFDPVPVIHVFQL